ncbi:hypothetical protein D3C85_1416700 [compost metagenome]
MKLIFNTSMETSAEKKIAVPVAEIGSSLNTAGMAVGAVTIGATLITIWSRCGMAKLKTQPYIEPPAANMALKGLRVQRVTSTVRIRNGDQALKIWPRL